MTERDIKGIFFIGIGIGIVILDIVIATSNPTIRKFASLISMTGGLCAYWGILQLVIEPVERCGSVEVDEDQKFVEEFQEEKLRKVEKMGRTKDCFKVSIDSIEALLDFSIFVKETEGVEIEEILPSMKSKGD